MRGIVLTLGGVCLVALTGGFSAGQTLPSTSPAASTQPVSLPSEIAAALNHEAAALGPTITVEFTENWDPPMKAKDYADATGAKNFDHRATFARSEKVHLTWQSDDRYFVARREFFQRSDSDRVILRANDRNSFDGAIFYSHGINPGEDHSLTRTDFRNKDEGEDINMQYFSLMGLPLPATADDLQKHAPLRTRILLLLDAEDAILTAVEPVTVDDRNLIRLKIQRGPNSPTIGGDNPFVGDVNPNLPSHQCTEYFYLDPSRAYAQVRWESFAIDGKLLARTDCSDFRALGNRGIYLPHIVVCKDYGGVTDETSLQSTIMLTHIDLNAIPADEFVLTDTMPGTWIVDRFGSSKQQIHIVQQDGSLKLRK